MATARTRYIGSNRAREAGFSATHKQDFTAHVTGGDFLHLASDIVAIGIPYSTNVQEALIYLADCTLDIITSAHISVDSTIPVFNGTSGTSLRDTAVVINGFNDIIFPADNYHIVTVAETDSPLPGLKPSLLIAGQNNRNGAGGDLWLLSGFNYISGQYDGMISLFTPNLQFNKDIVNPSISQEASNLATSNDLVIAAQSSIHLTGTPGSLWLEPGYNNNNNVAGNIYLFSDPGGISFMGTIISDIMFGSTITPHIGQTGVSGIATDLYIDAQSSVNNHGGSVWISSGLGLPGHDGYDGYINIFAGSGQVNIGGTNFNGSGGVNLMGIAHFPNSGAPATFPIGGASLYASGGILRCMGADGIEHQIPEAAVMNRHAVNLEIGMAPGVWVKSVGYGCMTYWSTTSLSNNPVTFDITDIIPSFCTIVGFGGSLLPDGYHTGLPATMPTVSLVRRTILDDPGISWSVITTATDTSASVGIYDAVHLIGTTANSVVNQNLTAYRWGLQVVGELSTNSRTGLVLLSLWIEVI